MKLTTHASARFAGFLLWSLLADAGMAASFDCKQARTFVERGICADQGLSSLDSQLGAAFQSALQISFAPAQLRQEQQKWVAETRNRCQDEACLRRVYRERVATLVDLQRRQREGHEGTCDSLKSALPADYALYAAGTYGGRRLDVQIDESGHEATQVDLTVNEPTKPVVLMLGMYEPTIWNVRWTQGTRIAAVLVSGYYRQAVAGLPPEVPQLNTSYENKGTCGYFYVSPNDLSMVNPMARKVFGRAADMVWPGKAGNADVLVGNPVGPGAKLLTSDTTSPMSFVDPDAPLAGRAGLAQAVAKGLLRPATEADVDAWMNAQRPVIARTGDLPPVAGVEAPPLPRRPIAAGAYVVLGKFRYPAGLFGGNGSTFFIPRGVPQPEGNPGHSYVYDFNSIRCLGPLCQ